MRISDWSSDVCSSDLRVRNAAIEIDPLARRQFLAALRQTKPHAPLNAVQRKASRDKVRGNLGPGTHDNPDSFTALRLDESGRIRPTQPPTPSMQITHLALFRVFTSHSNNSLKIHDSHEFAVYHFLKAQTATTP